MDHSKQEIFDLIQKLENVLLQLDKGGYSLPAIKVEEGILALKQLTETAKDTEL
ncbi:MAG: hypothetical protein ABJN65_08165 [Parasphingorhabdus sp.]